MTVLLFCEAVAAAALAWHLVGLAAKVRAARWPASEPGGVVDDDRSQDPRVAQLARLLRTSNLAQAHRTVVALAEQLRSDGQVFDAQVDEFLARPPLGRPDRYRRQLDMALARMEQM